MLLRIVTRMDTQASADRAFAVATDQAVFLSAYRGHGLIPGLRGIDAPLPHGVGSVRRVHVSDGSVLTETVTAWLPGRQHAYTLAGFMPPLRWLLTEARAQWDFEAIPDGCRITWRYDFQPRTQLAAWILRGLLLPSMRRTLQRCLGRLVDHLHASER